MKKILVVTLKDGTVMRGTYPARMASQLYLTALVQPDCKAAYLEPTRRHYGRGFLA